MDITIPFYLSGVKWQRYVNKHEDIYTLVETLHKLLCLLSYHNLAIPLEAYPCLDFKTFVEISKNNDSSSSSLNSDEIVNMLPVHVQLQRYLYRLFCRNPKVLSFLPIFFSELY